MTTCNICKKEFESERKRNSHLASHRKSYCSYCGRELCATQLKRHELACGREQLRKQNLSCICEKCGKVFTEDYRKDLTEIRRQPIPRFCSRSCRNTHEHTEENRLQISRSLKSFYEQNPLQRKTSTERNCIICGEVFSAIHGYDTKQTCGEGCKRRLLSKKRGEYLSKNGSKWKSERRLFIYKDIELECDSALEEAGIIYLKDILQADTIERYRNLVNYYEDGTHRCYNPDFWALKGSQVYLVEVKMKWLETSTHFYNRTIPLKREALEKFCKDKGYVCIWLDFDYDHRFQEIYKEHLKSGSGRNHFQTQKISAGVSPHSDKV